MLKNDLQKIVLGLFTSRVRVKLISLFFTNPRDSFHMRQISRITGEQINAVRRELISLEKAGLLTSQQYGIKKFYSLNASFPLFNEIRSIFVKTYGLGYYVFLNRKELGNVIFAILTHTYLNREDSEENNPDLIIVGEVNRIVLERIIRDSEEFEKRKIHYKILSAKELEIAKKRKDLVIYSALVLPRSMIIGTDEDFVMYGGII
ncbi:MAG: hypothetical protein KatS3mg083_065 [Candidatus Dojkabacteria bacterium]|nr:MAG: hypothetical protein KatS3mg083_065 [Candidatus Dojkabacteria bacterium]